MKYLDLISELKKNKVVIFSLRDVENLFPQERLKTLKNNLSRWVKMGRFVKLRRNLYEFVEPGTESDIPDVYVANKLYFPSYISLQTALSIYSLIPDVAMHVTSLSTQPSRQFKNKHGWFLYKSCQRRAFTGYRLMQYSGFKILIADKEKALVDYIYFAVRHQNSLNFDEERFNEDILRELNWKKVVKYGKLFNNKTLITLQKLKEWARC